MSKRKRNRKRNRHVITYYWRGDNEDMRYWSFPTKDDAWAHVVGNVRKRIRNFSSDENVDGHGKTVVDWERLHSELFGNGYAEVVYCQCSAWWDNWGYFEKVDDVAGED